MITKFIWKEILTDIKQVKNITNPRYYRISNANCYFARFSTIAN